jgi:hypothetical protein
MSQKPLNQAVQARLGEVAGSTLFSPEALDALRLSDIFESVRPQEYVLPLDAMAGFPRHVSSDKDIDFPADKIASVVRL